MFGFGKRPKKEPQVVSPALTTPIAKESDYLADIRKRNEENIEEILDDGWKDRAHDIANKVAKPELYDKAMYEILEALRTAYKKGKSRQSQ